MVSDAFRACVAGFAWYLYVEHLKVSRLASRWLELHGGMGLWGKGQGALASLSPEQVSPIHFFTDPAGIYSPLPTMGSRGIHPQTF